MQVDWQKEKWFWNDTPRLHRRLACRAARQRAGCGDWVAAGVGDKGSGDVLTDRLAK